MAKISIKTQSIGSRTLPSEMLSEMRMRFSKEVTERRLAGIKNEMLDRLQGFIQRSKRRDSEVHDEPWRLKARNNLFNVIKAGCSVTEAPGEHVADAHKFRLALGEYALLRQYAPYYRIINYGGKVNVPLMFIKGKWRVRGLFGHFGQGDPPGTGSRSQTFKMGSDPLFLMIPRNPIPPMHYYEFWDSQFTIVLKELEAKFRAELDAATRAKKASVEKKEKVIEKVITPEKMYWQIRKRGW